MNVEYVALIFDRVIIITWFFNVPNYIIFQRREDQFLRLSTKFPNDPLMWHNISNKTIYEHHTCLYTQRYINNVSQFVTSSGKARLGTKRTGFDHTPRVLRGIWSEPGLFVTYMYKYLQIPLFSLCAQLKEQSMNMNMWKMLILENTVCSSISRVSSDDVTWNFTTCNNGVEKNTYVIRNEFFVILCFVDRCMLAMKMINFFYV